jgi:hypothetical protein
VHVVAAAQLPGTADVTRFVTQLRSHRRVSALRGLLDGAVVAVTLRRRGARPLLGAAAPPSARWDVQDAIAVSTAVDAGLALLPLAPTCLRRSMTLMRELNRLHLAANLHIGVRSVSGNVEAHAWVQVGDVVVNDEPDVRTSYVELASGDLDLGPPPPRMTFRSPLRRRDDALLPSRPLRLTARRPGGRGRPARRRLGGNSPWVDRRRR